MSTTCVLGMPKGCGSTGSEVKGFCSRQHCLKEAAWLNPKDQASAAGQAVLNMFHMVFRLFEELTWPWGAAGDMVGYRISGSCLALCGVLGCKRAGGGTPKADPAAAGSSASGTASIRRSATSAGHGAALMLSGWGGVSMELVCGAWSHAVVKLSKLPSNQLAWIATTKHAGAKR